MKTNIFPLSEKTISLTKELLNSMATVRTVYPKVRNYQKKILKELGAKSVYTGKSIVDPDSAYMLDEKVMTKYIKRCDEEAIKLGFLITEPGNCPLLQAINKEIEAKRAFGEHILTLLPDYENISYDDMLDFEVDEKGKIILNDLGKGKFLVDTLIELTLNLIVPHLDSSFMIMDN